MYKSFFLNKEEREYRKSLCDSCESKNGFRCKECGCFLVALQKVRRWHCPLNKWDPDEESRFIGPEENPNWFVKPGTTPWR